MSDDTLVAALAKAQAGFGAIHKAHTNPHFGNKYADLNDIFVAVRPVLAAEGIALIQVVEDTEQGCYLVTKLLKGSDVIESRMPLEVGGKMQELGSRLTYLKRYMVSALLAVAADDDDDGNAANDAPPRENAWQGGTRFPSSRPATPKQIGLAAKLLKEVVHQNQELGFIEDTVGRAAPVEDLNAAEMSKLIDALYEAKKAGRTPDGAVPDDGTEPF